MIQSVTNIESIDQAVIVTAPSTCVRFRICCLGVNSVIFKIKVWDSGLGFRFWGLELSVWDLGFAE